MLITAETYQCAVQLHMLLKAGTQQFAAQPELSITLVSNHDAGHTLLT